MFATLISDAVAGSIEQVPEAAVFCIAAVTLALAWFVYRWERDERRKTALRATEKTLLAVREAVASWGKLYFEKLYDADAIEQVGRHYGRLTLKGSREQVLVVPREPIELLLMDAGRGGSLSGATLKAANYALWRIDVFNQLVIQQTELTTKYLLEIKKPFWVRPVHRLAIRRAIVDQARMLHRFGIGMANTAGGWYYELERAITDDIAAISAQLNERAMFSGRKSVVDVLAVGLAVGSVALLGNALVHHFQTAGGDRAQPTTSATQSGSPPVIRESFTALECPAHPTSTLDFEGCSEKKLVASDLAVNATAASIFHLLRAVGERDAFVRGEQSWLAYRRSSCLAESSEYAGGSLEPVAFVQCEQDRTATHVADLRSMRKVLDQH